MYGSRTSSSSSGASTSTALFGFDGVPAACSGAPTAGLITTAAMNAASPLCAGSTKSLTATDPNSGAPGLSYQWQSSTSSAGPFANVSGGSGATTLSYTTGALPTTTWFRLGIRCNNSNITTYSTPYQVIIGAQQPAVIMGRSGSCPGDTATYTVPAVTGNTYNWTLPSGWTGTSTTNSILVTMGANPGTISVTATGCGGTSIARTRAIVAGNAPSAPAAIAGFSNACPGTPQTYSVAPILNANSYSWTLPSGWTGTSTSNSITVMTGTTGGSVSVKAINGCGNSATAAKTVNIITSLSSPGTITSSAVGGVYCSGALYNFSINPVPGATAYTWALPSGWSGTVTGTSIQAIAGNSGQVSVTAHVACATSPTVSLATSVTSTVTPSVSIAPPAGVLCQGTAITFAATPTNGGSGPTYVWKKNGAVVGFGGSSYTSSTLANGDMISVAMTSNAVCRAVDTVSSATHKTSLTPSITPGISINSNPVITICEGTNMSFRTVRTGSGISPTYQWLINGKAVGGANDTSFYYAGFVDGDTLSVVMTSNAVCATMPQTMSNNVAIAVRDTVHPSISISASTVLPGQPATFIASQTGGGTTPDYQWILNNVDIPGASGDTYNSPGLAAGDRLAVRMQSYAECAQPAVVTSEELIIQGAASVGNAGHWNGLVNVFPNPTSGRFTIAAEWTAQQTSTRIDVTVYNMVGQQVYHSSITPAAAKWRHEVTLSDAIPAGHYNIRLTTSDGGIANIPMMLTR
jgi:hypothetical protein